MATEDPTVCRISGSQRSILAPLRAASWTPHLTAYRGAVPSEPLTKPTLLANLQNGTRAVQLTHLPPLPRLNGSASMRRATRRADSRRTRVRVLTVHQATAAGTRLMAKDPRLALPDNAWACRMGCTAELSRT